MLKLCLCFFLACVVFIQAGCSTPSGLSEGGLLKSPPPDFLVGMWYHRVPGEGDAVTNTIVFRSDGSGKIRMYQPAPPGLANALASLSANKTQEKPHGAAPVSFFSLDFGLHWSYAGDGKWIVHYQQAVFEDGVYHTDGVHLIQTAGVFSHTHDQKEPVVWLRKEREDAGKTE